jgi:hypothetical protein
MSGRLNAFQLSMLQWNDLHPYNAAHVVRVPEKLDVELLRNALGQTLERKGLSGLMLNRGARTYEYRGGSADVGITIVESPHNSCGKIPGQEPRSPSRAGASPAQSWTSQTKKGGRDVDPPLNFTGTGAPSPTVFAEEIERQLNTPFAYGDSFTPFRCVVFAEQDAFALAVVYFHPIADAESIVFLLRDIVDFYRGTGQSGVGQPFERYPPPRDNLLRSHPAVLARKLASLPSSMRRMRLACRPNYRDAGDFQNKLTLFSLNEAALARMVESAKAIGVTLNDLFLGILMKATSVLAPDRAQSGRRKNLAIGCIVNTRRDLGLDGRRDFGLFLGSFLVHHPAPAGIALAELARDIGGQTRLIKEKQLYLGAALELSFGRMLISLFSASRRKKLYQKHYPLWGGLTNMNLNALWPQPEETRSVDYLRAVCTGPVTPLVASITTMGRAANVSLTYRSTVFGAEEIERVKACFLDPAGLAAAV